MIRQAEYEYAFEKAYEIGVQRVKRETATALLENGYSDEFILEVTELSFEDFQGIKKDLENKK